MNRTLKILVVEDFSFTRKQEVIILRELGFIDIAEAKNGEQAISILKEKRDIDLIISDWNMPEMGGMDLLRYIRSDEQLKTIPFIMATAQGETSVRSEAEDAGASGFITKPFTGEDLRGVLETVSRKMAAAGDQIEQGRPGPNKIALKAAHIQITDHLALGVLDRMILEGKFSPTFFDLETVCMASWNTVRQALEKGTVDCAFVLAPIAMDLYQARVPVKLVLFAHRNGSICIRNIRGNNGKSLHDFMKSKVFFIPHILSIHHILANMFLSEIGLKLGPVGKEGIDVFYEVVPPIKMPKYLSGNPDVCGFIVAEPMGTKTILEGNGDILFNSGELWQNHPCCVLVFRNEYIERHTDAVFEFVEMLVESGRFITDNPERSADIGAAFLDPVKSLGLNRPLLLDILRGPSGIKTDDMFPVMEDLEIMQRYMVEKMAMGSLIDLEKFVDSRFADNASGFRKMKRRESNFFEPSRVVTGIVNRSISFSESRESSKKVESEFDGTKRSQTGMMEVTRLGESIRFRISSEMKLVDDIARQGRKFLNDLGGAVFSEFKLVLRELLINAIEHGNKNNREKPVVCEITRIREDFFRISVTDKGNGFDYNNIPKSILEGSEMLNHRGRGYPIIFASSEKVVFSDKGRRVTAYVRTQWKTEFKVSDEDGWKVVQPSGDITASVAGELQKLVHELIGKGHRKLKFDLESVGDMDSVSLSVFIVLNKMRKEIDRDIQIRIENAGKDVVNLFRMTRLNKAFQIGLKKEEENGFQ